MAPGEVPEYIEPMTGPALLPQTSPPRPSLAPWRLPGQCVVCRSWQRQVLCQRCTQAFAPPTARCTRCALPLERCNRVGENDICSSCEAYPPLFDRAVAAVDYLPPWSQLIAQFKFQHDVALSATLVKLMLPPLRGTGPRPHCIVPVPLSTARLRERGYNQSWLLAQGLGRALQIPAWPLALRRLRDTPPLMTLSADQRRAHITGAFGIDEGSRRALAGRHIAVVDDVMTSGATLNEIAATLQDVGARSVSVWVVARTPSPRA